MNILRQGTVTWPGREECLRRARKKVFERVSKKGTDIFKLHWQCAKCRKWFRDKSMLEVDHIIEIGGFKGSWDEIISRMYCSQDNLQAMCKDCHLKKTTSNASLKYSRKAGADE